MPAKNFIYIKNMVCQRCIKVIGDELSKLGIAVSSITLGEVRTVDPVDKLPVNKIKQMLEENGFELIEERRIRIIEEIKKTVIDAVQNPTEENAGKRENISQIIEKKISLDYPYLSSLFSSIESITLEQYYILQKIEKAKELLKYDELTLSEIAYRLGYSSVQHLSNQFKKITGMTAGQFKNLSGNARNPIDKVK